MTSIARSFSIRSVFVFLTAAAVFVVSSRDAEAACFAAPRATPARFDAHTSPGARLVDVANTRIVTDAEADRRSPVGLWRAVFLLGNGPAKYDETFQAIHDDGTEMMISNGLPPVLGNVCVGAWKQEGPAIRMKHMTWNWDAESRFAGTFVMTVTFRVSRNGNRYDGQWSAANFDPDGNPIPELDAEGTVHALRLTAR